jgi:hypothetical protein
MAEMTQNDRRLEWRTALSPGQAKRGPADATDGSAEHGARNEGDDGKALADVVPLDEVRGASFPSSACEGGCPKGRRFRENERLGKRHRRPSSAFGAFSPKGRWKGCSPPPLVGEGARQGGRGAAVPWK